MRRRNPPAQQDDQVHRDRLLRPPTKRFKQKLKDLFWDREKKTCLTRTPLNWCMITIYYIIFCSIILLIFAGAMSIVYFYLNTDTPQYLLGDSPIGTSPRLNFFPMDGTNPLLWLSGSRSYDSYVKRIDDVFDRYKEVNSSFKMDELGECGKSPYGYDDLSPCIFLRLNRILKWVPEPYNESASLPCGVPDAVKSLIKGSPTSRIWVSCEGATAKDQDHLAPDFYEVQGEKGFDVSAFPYNMQKDFLDPVVAIKLRKPGKKKTLVTFHCYAWSSKLDVDKSRVVVNFYWE